MREQTRGEQEKDSNYDRNRASIKSGFHNTSAKVSGMVLTLEKVKFCITVNHRNFLLRSSSAPIVPQACINRVFDDNIYTQLVIQFWLSKSFSLTLCASSLFSSFLYSLPLLPHLYSCPFCPQSLSFSLLLLYTHCGLRCWKVRCWRHHFKHILG